MFLLFLLLFLMFVGYMVATDRDISVVFDTAVKKEIPVPNSKALGYCIIERDDLFSGSVYNGDKQMSANMSPIKCSDCNQYVYKTDDQCSPYMYDTTYNVLSNFDDSSKFTVFCDPAHPERNKNCINPHVVCTLDKSVSKTCKF